MTHKQPSARPSPTLFLVRLLMILALSGSSVHAKNRTTCPAGTSRIDGEQVMGGREEYCQKQIASGEYVKHGPFQAWNEEGLLVLSGMFDEGLETGEWTGFHGGAEVGNDWTLKKNQKSFGGRYLGGRRVGPWTEWHANGQKAAQITYSDGQIEGLATKWFPNGRKASDSQYRNGKPHGRTQAWHENGSPQLEATYVDGVADGIWTKWFGDGAFEERGEFAKGIRVGPWSVWSAAKSLLWSGEFNEQGVAHGHWVQMVPSTYSLTMALDAKYEGEVVNGRREGAWSVVDGPEEYIVHFRADKYDGLCESKHKGVLHVRATYKDGFEAQVVLFKQNLPYMTWEVYGGRDKSCTPQIGEGPPDTPDCRLVRRPSCIMYGFPKLPSS